MEVEEGKLSYMISNLIGCGTYCIVDEPSNGGQFLDVSYESMLEEWVRRRDEDDEDCEDEEDEKEALESMVHSYGKIEDLDIAYREIFVDNGVDIDMFDYYIYMQRIIDDYNSEEYYYLAWYSSEPPTVAQRVEKAKNSKVEEQRLIAKDMHQPIEVFEVLVKVDDEDVLEALASNEKVPAHVLKELILEGSREMQCRVMMNPNADEDILRELTNSEYSDVKDFIGRELTRRSI